MLFRFLIFFFALSLNNFFKYLVLITTFSVLTIFFSYQATENQLTTFLQRNTIEKLWAKETEVPFKPEKSRMSFYGLGWMIVEPIQTIGGVSPHQLSGFW